MPPRPTLAERGKTAQKRLAIGCFAIFLMLVGLGYLLPTDDVETTRDISTLEVLLGFLFFFAGLPWLGLSGFLGFYGIVNLCDRGISARERQGYVAITALVAPGLVWFCMLAFKT